MASQAGSSLQDWLTHEDVDLAAYFPVFHAAGMHNIEVNQLSSRVMCPAAWTSAAAQVLLLEPPLL